MRGIETGKVRIRHEVFTEIARMAYEGGDYAKRLEELPFKIIPGEIGSYRDSLFLERAVVGDAERPARSIFKPADTDRSFDRNARQEQALRLFAFELDREPVFDRLIDLWVRLHRGFDSGFQFETLRSGGTGNHDKRGGG